MEEIYVKCSWCENEYEEYELKETNLGLLCDGCIRAIKSRGEDIWVKQ